MLFLLLALGILTLPSVMAAKPTVPVAPSNLVATPVSSTTINLAWVDNSTDETGFTVQRAGSATGTFTAIANLGSGVTSYSDKTGLSPSTSYYYRVFAINQRGSSAFSNVASATTLAPPDTTAPSIPTGLKATAFSSNQMDLTWNASSDPGGSGVAGYTIYRDGTQVGTTSATTYSDLGLAGSIIYCYTVTASDNAGNTSVPSTSVCQSTPAPPDTIAPSTPTGLTASPVSPVKLNLLGTRRPTRVVQGWLDTRSFAARR